MLKDQSYFPITSHKLQVAYCKSMMCVEFKIWHFKYILEVDTSDLVGRGVGMLMWTVWHHLAPFDHIWPCLALFDSGWLYLPVFVPVWHHLSLAHLTSLTPFYPSLPLFYTINPHLSLFNLVWPYLTVFGKSLALFSPASSKLAKFDPI